ncbi:MAG: malonyl-[acyl-carrier protein] O-methyltransferase BioC [Elusimicrobia bacterium RIFOXYD2_FULL_34_15]|nr:MAG: malonyl-[acyl-carrier protein] O-methyltransferase BioC [Elusimicrobia bacterium RIFOXYD2_FULL_34_15]
MDKEIIIKNFSMYAHIYDKYANVQQIIANELIDKIPERINSKILFSDKNDFKRILEIGCGTGNYTFLLREKYKNACIKAMDISDKMIEVAKHKLRDKNIKFVIGDAETINLDTKFDIITSNATFQWFKDIEETVVKYKNILVKGGIILFSTFGPLTFYELKKSINETLRKKTFIASDNFLEKEKIETILRKYFNEVSIREKIFSEDYSTLMNLLNKIKYSGERGSGINGKFILTKDILKKIEHTYISIYGRITASYQVFFCRVKK